MTPACGRRPMMAIIGDGGVIKEPLHAAAHALGRMAIDACFRITTGGLGGVMAAASEGARSSPAWRDGDIIGILPGYDRTAANPFVDVPIATGMQYGRNVIVVATSDVVVALGGKSGTLSEIALAWQLGKPIIAIDSNGGWAARMAGQVIDDRNASVVHTASSPEAAVLMALELLAGVRPEPGAIGSGWRKKG